MATTETNGLPPFNGAVGYDTTYVGKDIASLGTLNHIPIHPALLTIGNLGLQGGASLVLGGLLLKNAKTMPAQAQATFKIVQGAFQALGGVLYAAASFIKSSGQKVCQTLLTTVKKVSTIASKMKLASSLSFVIGGLFFALGYGVTCYNAYTFYRELKQKAQEGDASFCGYLESLVSDPEKANCARRELGTGCVLAISQAHEKHLSNRLQATDNDVKSRADAEFQVLKNQVLKASEKRKNTLLTATIVATLFIGIAVAAFFTFPFSALALGIAALIVFSTMLGIDLYTALRNQELPGRHDTKYHLFVILSTILIAVVSVACGCVPLVLGAIFVAAGVGTALISLGKMKMNERAFKEKNITLKAFNQECQKRKDRLGPKGVDGKILQLFKKLPKEEQQKIQAKWTLNENEPPNVYADILVKGKKNTNDFLLLTEAMENLLKKEWTEELQKIFEEFQKEGELGTLTENLKALLKKQIYQCEAPFKDASEFFKAVSELVNPSK